MKLSQHIYKTSNGLFNLLTATFLPKDASDEELSNNYFFEGQELQAIHHRLYDDKIEIIGIKITPTWRCNLRCKHCFVLNKLVQKDSEEFQVPRLCNFLRNAIVRCPSLTKMQMAFVGGEVSLEATKCIEILDAFHEIVKQAGIKSESTVTTNGTIWSESLVELVDKVDWVTISLDGDEENHNAQRKVASPDLKGMNVYKTTLRNIKRLVLMGYTDKIRVQAALSDESFGEEQLQRFYKDVIQAGVPHNRITVGSIMPTHQRPEAYAVYHQYLQENLFKSPCCKWRIGRELVIDASHQVYADYFEAAENSLLGTLEDDFDHIKANHEELVRKTLPVLNDAKCLKCPVVGACWGRCSTDFLNPSSICDQQGLHQTVLGHAEKDTLVNEYKRFINYKYQGNQNDSK